MRLQLQFFCLNGTKINLNSPIKLYSLSNSTLFPTLCWCRSIFFLVLDRRTDGTPMAWHLLVQHHLYWNESKQINVTTITYTDGQRKRLTLFWQMVSLKNIGAQTVTFTFCCRCYLFHWSKQPSSVSWT